MTPRMIGKISQEFIRGLTDLRLLEVKNTFLKHVPLNNKKKSNNCLDCLESLMYSFFTFRSHQQCKMFVQKEKLQFRKQNMCVLEMSFYAIFLLNKIMASIFQIIHIQIKNLHPCINVGLELRHKVQIRLQCLFTFWH